MCETFHLEFSYEHGIFAWADPELYEEFAGPQMRIGDFWKIHLGRRITLDDDDFDGSDFIEGLIEDALLFPLRDASSLRDFEKWETVEESPGIWVTRLKDDGSLESDDSDVDDVDDEDSTERGDFQPPNDDFPVHLRNYTLDSDDDGDDEDAMEEDPDYTCHHAYPDAAWLSCDEGDKADKEYKEEDTSTLSGDQDMDTISSDSADSDFNDGDIFTEDESLVAAYWAKRTSA